MKITVDMLICFAIMQAYTQQKRDKMYEVTVNSMSVEELRLLEFKMHRDIFHGVTFESCAEADRFANKCKEIVPHAEYWIGNV